jgi:hypothetical protein
MSMSRPFGSKNKAHRVLRRDQERISAATKRTRIVRSFTEGIGPTADGKIDGLSARQARRILNRSMERVAAMTEHERQQLVSFPTLPPEGSRMREALNRRIQGLSYAEIADELSISTQVAHDYVSGAIERLTGEEVRSAEIARQLQLLRLDVMLAALWPKVLDGNVNAAQAVLKIMERQSKLLGLDAPVRIDIEHRIREMAAAEGLDPDEAVEEARAIIKRLPPS